MSQELLSVFDIAERLNVHVRTVRNYVRDGRLRALRVGKQYRISREDLEAFTGAPLPQTASERAVRARASDASSVVSIDAVSPAQARELEKALSALAAMERDRGARLNVECRYEHDTGRLDVEIKGDLATASAGLRYVQSWLEA